MDTSKLGIAVIAHQGHRRFLKPCIDSCKKMNPARIVVVYDARFTAAPTHPIDRILPMYDVIQSATDWYISDVGPRVNSWLWLSQTAMSLLKNTGVEYVLSINGDCMVGKPDGIHTIKAMMEEESATIITSDYRGEGFAGTTSYFTTIDIGLKITNHLVENALKPRMPDGKAFGNPEGRMGKAISIQGIVCAKNIRNPEHGQFSYGDRGTWGDVLDFNHLHGAEKWRKGNNKLPFPRECYDMRYVSGGEKEALEYYWETGKTDRFVELGYWK